jgi:hypothetical protein
MRSTYSSHILPVANSRRLGTCGCTGLSNSFQRMRWSSLDGGGQVVYPVAPSQGQGGTVGCRGGYRLRWRAGIRLGDDLRAARREDVARQMVLRRSRHRSGGRGGSSEWNPRFRAQPIFPEHTSLAPPLTPVNYGRPSSQAAVLSGCQADSSLTFTPIETNTMLIERAHTGSAFRRSAPSMVRTTWTSLWEIASALTNKPSVLLRFSGIFFRPIIISLPSCEQERSRESCLSGSSVFWSPVL